jgi:hypothetical protein
MLFLLAPLVPVISVTIGEALAYAAAGTVLGYAAKETYDSYTDRDGSSEKRGESRAKAEYDTRLSRFEQAMQEMRAHDKHYFDVILAVATVGYAYAAAYDGEVSEEMRDYINDFVAGQGAGHLPPSLRRKLNDLFKAPPDVDTAYENAMVLAPNAIELCDMIIELLAERLEGSNSLAARKFVSSWSQLKAAA